MKNKNLSWVGALFVFALLLWCTAVTPGKVADPATYTCAVYSTFFSLLPPVIAIVLALNTKEVYTSLLVGIASGALLYANGNLELALNTLFFNVSIDFTSSFVKPNVSSNSTSVIEYTLKLFKPVKILSFAIRKHPVSTAKARLSFVFNTFPKIFRIKRTISS